MGKCDGKGVFSYTQHYFCNVRGEKEIILKFSGVPHEEGRF